jgi:hypothetical protein
MTRRLPAQELRLTAICMLFSAFANLRCPESGTFLVLYKNVLKLIQLPKNHFMKTKLPFGLKENSFVAVVAIGLLSVIFLINFIAFFG